MIKQANTKPSTATSSHSRGVTLVELLVAMVLGLFLIGGVISIYTSTQQNFRVNEAASRIQENARFAFEIMGRDMREAGGNACGATAWTSVIRDASANTPFWADWSAGSLVGYEGNDDIGNITVGSSTAQRVTATDAILIKRAAIEDNKLRAIAAHNTATFELTLSGTPPNGIKEKDIAVACDSVSAAIFQVSADSANAISHGIKPFNCTTSLGFPAQPDCSAPIVKSFATGGFAAPYEPVIWYIGNNSAGRKSLYRATLVVNSGGDGASFNPAEMVEDVVDLQLDYLTYTKAAVPTMATDWVKADDAKFAAASGGFGPTNNQQIVAVRAILTFNSQETIGNDGTGAKKVERKTMSVIGLRNRDIRETL